VDLRGSCKFDSAKVSSQSEQQLNQGEVFSVSAAPFGNQPVQSAGNSSKLKKSGLMGRLPLHEHITRGWDMTNERWRDPVWPKLDKNFKASGEQVGNPGCWELHRDDNEVIGPMDESSDCKGKGKAAPSRAWSFLWKNVRIDGGQSRND